MMRATRLNGANVIKPNITYSSGGVDDEPLNENRRRRKRNQSHNANFPIHYSHFSSHSSSRFSSSSSDEGTESTESSTILFQMVLPTRSSNSSAQNGTDKTSEPAQNTPIANRSRTQGLENTPDSGISTSASCGSSLHKQDGNINSNAKTSVNGSDPNKTFLQKVARVRRNYRNIGDVSYSEDSE